MEADNNGGLGEGHKKNPPKQSRSSHQKQKTKSDSTSDTAHDSALAFERSLLQCVLECPELINQIECDLVDDFLLSDHRALWRAALKLQGEGIKPDLASLVQESEVDVAYISDLFSAGAMPENFQSYVRHVQDAAQERRFRRLHEELGTAAIEDRQRILEQIQSLQTPTLRDDWRNRFHSYAEVASAPIAEWLIENFAEVEDIVMLGGPSGHGKSLLLLSLCRALLTQEPLFGYPKFQVPKPATRVLYLIPEVGLRAFRRRIEWFGLLPFVKSDRLFIRTQNSGPVISLDDPVLLSAVQGSDIILDTAIRFSEGDESSSADNRDGLAALLFGLGRAGARSVLCAHHSPKDYAKQTELTLENCLRGSGDIGAMLSTAYGIRQVDRATNRILIQCIKPRDIEPLGPFEVQGRPFIADVGDFRVISEPSDQPSTEALADATSRNVRLVARELFAQGISGNEIAKALKAQGKGVRRGLLSRWQREFQSQGVSAECFPLRTGNAETPQANTL